MDRERFAVSGSRSATSRARPTGVAPNPGVDRFVVVNRSHHPATVYLFHAQSGAIVGSITGLKPGSTRQLSSRLTPGLYAWGCDLNGFPRHVSDAARVPRHAQVGGPGPTVIPLLPGELGGPLVSYRRYVASLIGVLRGQVATLAADLHAGNVSAASSAWLAAHLTWLSIGQDDGAYGAFGDLGREIDGTAAGLVDGTADRSFTGFHKIEFDIWTRDDIAAAAQDADRLVVARRRADSPEARARAARDAARASARGCCGRTRYSRTRCATR